MKNLANWFDKSVYHRLSQFMLLAQLLGLVAMVIPKENWCFFTLLASLFLLDCFYVIYLIAYWWHCRKRSK